MPRFTVILMILTLAIALNFALAFAFVAWMPTIGATRIQQVSSTASGVQQVTVEHRFFGWSRINHAAFSELTLDPATSDIQIARWTNDDAWSEIRAGFPFRCLWCRNASDVTIMLGSSQMSMSKSAVSPVEQGWSLSPIAANPPGFAWRALPLGPLWLGLIMNTLLWSSAMIALYSGSRRYVIARRRKRGMCTACGYDLTGGGSVVCPECGC